MGAFTNYLRNAALWLDEGGNTLFVGLLGLFVKIPAPAEGNPHYTISQVLAELRERGYVTGCIGCKVLTWIFKPFNLKDRHYDHCIQAMKGMPENITSG